MFNNTTSYPLLLIQSLDQTGILKSLIVEDESTSKAISRAKSYFLVFATVSSCLTFAVGPRLIDMEHAPDSHEEEENKDDGSDDDEDGNEADEENEIGRERILSADGDVSPTTETTNLLAVPNGNRQRSVVPVSFFPSKAREDIVKIKKTTNQDRRPSVIAKKKWFQLSERTRWWLLFFYDFVNAPVLGALAGAVIGLVPKLHVAFFSDTYDGGIFTAWLTESLKNIGGLFVPLPVVIAGVSLYTAYKKSKSDPHGQAAATPWGTTIFILVVRFVVWPVFSIAVIYYLAKRTDFLGDDPMLWFALML